MAAQGTQAIQPAQLVRAPTGATLYARLAVVATNSTLVSLLPGGVIPTILAPGVSGPAGAKFVFKGVWLQSETAFGTAQVRYTADGQTAASATSGLPVNDPTHSNPTVIMADIQDIQLCASIAGPTFVQCYLVVAGITTATGIN